MLSLQPRAVDPFGMSPERPGAPSLGPGRGVLLGPFSKIFSNRRRVSPSGPFTSGFRGEGGVTSGRLTPQRKLSRGADADGSGAASAGSPWAPLPGGKLGTSDREPCAASRGHGPRRPRGFQEAGLRALVPGAPSQGGSPAPSWWRLCPGPHWEMSGPRPTAVGIWGKKRGLLDGGGRGPHWRHVSELAIMKTLFAGALAQQLRASRLGGRAGIGVSSRGSGWGVGGRANRQIASEE